MENKENEDIEQKLSKKELEQSQQTKEIVFSGLVMEIYDNEENALVHLTNPAGNTIAVYWPVRELEDASIYLEGDQFKAVYDRTKERLVLEYLTK